MVSLNSDIKVDLLSQNPAETWSNLEIFRLALCWALTLSTSTLLTTVGPLAAKEVGSSDFFAPFTIGTFLIGAAVSSVPSGILFRKHGRFKGFAIGCAMQIVGALFCVFGVYGKSESLLFLGCFGVGLGQGLGQFYRFAAVEITPDKYKSKAVTYVLSGGVIAAFLGPTLASATADGAGKKYAGCFLVMALFGVLNYVILIFIKFPKADIYLNARRLHVRSRSLMTIVTQPIFLLACAVTTIAHTVMVMIMSSCTLAMEDDYSFRTEALVLELHFLAMFLPGFVTGALIKKHGSFIVSVWGAAVFALSAIIFGIGEKKWNFYFGMLLLGIAWNLSFSAGTIMLTDTYEPHEAADVQAVNDFVIFTVAGAGSLLSGVIYSSFSWAVLIYISAGLMFINLMMFSGVYEMRHSFKKGPSSTHDVEMDNTREFATEVDQDQYRESMTSITNDTNVETLGLVRTMSIT